MATVARRLTAEEAFALRPPRSLWSDAWAQFRRHRLAMVGVVVFAMLVLATAMGPLVWPLRIDAITKDALLGPSLDHPFGTDHLGRDIFARALWGGRVSILVGIVAVFISITAGTAIGAVSGFFGSRLDMFLMRLTDMFISLPTLPLLLLVVFLFRDTVHRLLGPEVGIFLLIVFVIGVLNWMPTARLVRGSILSIKQREFITAARTVGASDGRILLRHILPNVLSPVLVAATIGVGAAIITESALSFLGLGFPSDVPTWGRLLYDSQEWIELAQHWVFFPGFLIFLTVLSINYIGDGLRDALDPRKTI